MGTMSRLLAIRICCAGLAAIAVALVWLEVKHLPLDLQFAVVLLGGAALGLLVAQVLLPWLGDSVSASVYLPPGAPSSGEADTPDRVALLLEQGDYEGAVQALEEALLAQPHDVQRVHEITRICIEHLKDTARAAAFLDAQMAFGGWPDDGLAALMFRKAEVLALCHEQGSTARETLEAVIQRFPDSPHAARAHHLIHEQERGSSGV